MSKSSFFATVLIATLVFALPTESEEVRLTPAMERIQGALVEHARLLLERYGTTFYALGIYLTHDNELREVVPHISAPLEPALIAEGLRASVHEIYRTRASAVGIAVDNPVEKTVQSELEDLSGRCRLVRRPYRFTREGTVIFLAQEIFNCEISMLW